MKKIKRLFQIFKKSDFSKKIFLSLIFSIINFSLFAEVKIISPAVQQSTNFNNKQMLVLNITENEEVFYSFTSDDPLVSGFAYDGPVLLDVAGDVELNLAIVNSKNQKSKVKLNFTIDESKNENLQLDERNFINSLLEKNVIELPFGTEFEIPETFSYSINATGKKAKFQSGRSISVSKNSNLDRFLSLTLKSSSDDFWNFVIHSTLKKTEIAENNFEENVVEENELEEKILERNDVPFAFSDWEKLSLVDKKFIYSVDDEWWQGAGKTVTIDRSVAHLIKWQSVDFSSKNSIQTFLIPPMPKIKSEINFENLQEITFDDFDFNIDDFDFSKIPENLSSTFVNDFSKKIVVDSFAGENYSERIPVGVYFKNIYQGKLFVNLQSNNQILDSPKIILTANENILNPIIDLKKDSDLPSLKNSSTQKYFSRNDVIAKIDVLNYFNIPEKKFDEKTLKPILNFPNPNPDGIKIYYAVVSFKNVDFVKQKSFELPLVNLSEKAFKLYDGKDILLESDSEKCIAYKLICYAVDKWNNFSVSKTIDLIIDKTNYFVDSSSQNEICDGTYTNPFKDLSQFENIVNENNFSNFYISGKVDFPQSKIILQNSVKLIGESNAEICFSKKSNILLKNSSLEIQNIVVNNYFSDSEEAQTFFDLENANLLINNSAVSFSRFQNATLFNLNNSKIKIENSTVSTFANDYASIMSLKNSSAKIESCKIALGASTNVNFSCKNSALELNNSTCSVNGINSRICELFNSKLNAKNNIFESKADFKNSSSANDKPIWADEKSFVFEKNNNYQGF